MEARVCFLFVVFLINGILRVDCLLSCNDTLTACQCKGPGVDIDIKDALGYPYNISDGDSPQKYAYYFSPCTPLDACGGTAGANTVVMCQHNLQSTDNRDASLGIYSQVEWEVDSEKDFIIRYKGGDPDDKKKERWTEIHVTISGKQDGITYDQEDGSPTDHHTYKFMMSLKSDEPNIKGPPPPVGYVGIVIILLAITSLVLYFIIGTAVLYYVKGARGLEAFPNYAFWKELPILIKDGFCFTISPCRNKMGGQGKYQAL